MGMKSILTSLLSSLPLNRLASSITVYQGELEARESSAYLSQEAKGAVKKALELLGKSKEAVEKRELDKGWKCFHGAQRMELFSLCVKHELPARVKALRDEAEKLSSWRKKAVNDLLGTPDNPVAVEDIYSVFMAALIRDEHYNNQAYKGALADTFNLRLVLILIFTLIGFYRLISQGIIQFGDKFAANSLNALESIAMFGLFGAVVSAITKQMNVSDKSITIPEILTTWRITGLRIIGGAAFAVLVYIFWQSQMIDGIFSATVATALKKPTPYTIYAVAIAAGFSERFVLKAVEAVEGKKS